MKNQKLLKLFKMCIRKEQSDIIDKKFGKGETIKISSERGSITIFVVIAFIFCVTLLLGLYWKSANDQIVLLEEEQRIKEAYGRDVNNVENIYSKLSKPQDGLEEIFQDSTKLPYVTNYTIDVDGDGDPTDDWQVFYIEDYQGEEDVQADNPPTEGRRVFLIASDYAKIVEDLNSPIQKSLKKAGMVPSNAENQKEYVVHWNLDLCNNNWTLPNKPGSASIFLKLFKCRIFPGQVFNVTKAVGSLLCIDNWSDFVDTDYADYAIGAPTLEMYIDSYNTRHPEKTIYYSTNEFGYIVGTPNPQEGNGGYVVREESDTDLLYFPHASSETNFDYDNDGEIEFCEGYWLASPSGIYYTDNLMRVGMSWVSLADRYLADDLFGIRPIVALKSNVQLIQTETENVQNPNAVCLEIK